MAIPVGDYPYNGGKMGDPEASGLSVEAGPSGDVTVSRNDNTFVVDVNTTGTASGINSFAEGSVTLAQGNSSHAEGHSTTARDPYCHSEGDGTVARSNASHAEGYETLAAGLASHAEGNGTTTTNSAAHAEGYGTTASGMNSHAQGNSTIARGNDQTALGRFNIRDDSNQFAEIVGGGSQAQRKNIRTLDWSGNEHIAGEVYPGGGSESYGSKINAAKPFPITFTTDDWYNPTTVSMDVTAQQVANAIAQGRTIAAQLMISENGPRLFATEYQWSSLVWPLKFYFRYTSSLIRVNVASNGTTLIAIERTFMFCGKSGPYNTSSNVLIDDGNLTYADIHAYIEDVNTDPAIDYNGYRYRLQNHRTTGSVYEYWFGLCQSAGQGQGDESYVFQRVYRSDGSTSTWSKVI